MVHPLPFISAWAATNLRVERITPLGSCTASVPSGSVLDLTTGFNYGSGDNGNVMSWAAAGQQTFNRSYTYDGVNRLYTMSAPGSTCSGLSWSYDQWGNRTGQTVTGGTCGSSQLTFNTSNHVTNPGFQYDAAGNLVNDGVHSYSYDAENRVTQVDGGATAKYTYDPLGYRVEKIAGGVTTEYVYDPEGHVAVDANWTCGQSCWNATYFYLNGSAIAEYTSSSTEFVSGDHLGSMRLLTNVSGGVVDNMDYLPFGEQIAGASGTTHKFTGYERDAESNLDNAQARYNSSSLGRFMSPDPIGNFVADATNPQTWNLYGYVQNNPTGMVDPLGLTSIDPNQPPKQGPTHMPRLIYWDCDPDQLLQGLKMNGDGFWYSVGNFQSWTCNENVFLFGNPDPGIPFRPPLPRDTSQVPNQQLQLYASCIYQETGMSDIEVREKQGASKIPGQNPFGGPLSPIEPEVGPNVDEPPSLDLPMPSSGELYQQRIDHCAEQFPLAALSNNPGAPGPLPPH